MSLDQDRLPSARLPALPTALSAQLAFGVTLLFPGALKVVKTFAISRQGVHALDLARVLAADVAVACATWALTSALAWLCRRTRRGAWLYGAITTLYLLV